MKHNIIIKIGLLFMVIISVSACSDFLERDPMGVMDEDSYYTTDDAAMELLSNCYGTMLAGFPYAINRVAEGSESVDDADGGGSDAGDRPQVADVGTGKPETSNSLLLETWDNRYEGIGRCNSALEAFSAEGTTFVSGGNEVSEETISRYISEVKFLRAWYYFDLVTVFKEVPLIVSTLDASERVAKAGAEDIRTQLYDDLDAAINDDNLPRASELTDEELGRVSKDAAYVLKARIALYFAGLMSQGKMEGDATTEYKLAKSAAAEVINTGGLSLLDDYQELYRGDYETGTQSSECIFTVLTTYKGDIGMSTDAFAIMNVGRNNVGGWGGNCPTKDLASEFEVGDPRKIFTIISHGDIFPTLAGGEEYHDYSGYYNDFNLQQSRKAYVPQAHREDGNLLKSKWSPYWIRYSEVLLIYAEATLEIGGTNSEVAEYINMVRHRAFVTTSKKDEEAIYRKFEEDLFPIDELTFTSQYAVTTSDDLLKAIKHERRVELALEGLRLYDLIRWGDYATTMQAFYQKYGFADKGISASENSWPFPIPQTEIDASNGVLVQNSNY
jgi:starch-binding outer membrane protein, SusD/RagB family